MKRERSSLMITYWILWFTCSVLQITLCRHTKNWNQSTIIPSISAILFLVDFVGTNTIEKNVLAISITTSNERWGSYASCGVLSIASHVAVLLLTAVAGIDESWFSRWVLDTVILVTSASRRQTGSLTTCRSTFAARVIRTSIKFRSLGTDTCIIWSHNIFRRFHRLSWTPTPMHVLPAVLLTWNHIPFAPPFLPISSSTPAWFRLRHARIINSSHCNQKTYY